jgi:MFS family permease
MSSPLPEAALPATPEVMPTGIHNVYKYEVFNTASWCVVLGSPMLLFFQHLQATATILAIVGYRKFVLSGWTARSMVIIGMMIVAFLPDSVDRATRMILMLGLSFIYNAMRGISVCGILPWFTHIVPESLRGAFLAKDQLAGALAAIACLFVVGSLLRIHAWYSFGTVFFISAVCAFVSLNFLSKIPDVPVEKIARNDQPRPWREMFFYPPFFRYVCYNVVINAALGTSGVFWVRYFRTFLHLSDSNILFIACFSTMMLATGLFVAGASIDRAGNKPVLTASGLLFIWHFLGWGCVAARLIPFSPLVLGLQIFTSGLGGALWNLANVRMVMAIVPVMGRPHFLALYSVASNLTVGLVPLVWGVLVDYLEHWHVSWGIWEWNCYSLLYVTLALTIAAGLVALRSVAEPATMTWDVFMTELLVRTPGRGISRLIGRWRGPGIQ